MSELAILSHNQDQGKKKKSTTQKSKTRINYKSEEQLRQESERLRILADNLLKKRQQIAGRMVHDLYKENWQNCSLESIKTRVAEIFKDPLAG